MYRESAMTGGLRLLAAAAAGATAMYLLDPEQGARRRARLRSGAQRLERELDQRATRFGRRIEGELRRRGLWGARREPAGALPERGSAGEEPLS